MGCDQRCLVTALGDADEEPEAIDMLHAAGYLVASRLVNAHHHMFQNLTRAFGPVEARLRCGLVRSQHRVVGGRALVGNGELTLPDVDEMPKRHAEISCSWQGFHV
jgi:hypothetical protein